MASIPTFQASVLQLTDTANFEFMASIPDEMTDKFPIGNSIITEYTKTTVSGERLIPKELIVAMEIAAKSKRRGKRKQVEFESSPKPKKKKSKKKKVSTSSSQHQEEEQHQEEKQEDEEAHRNDDESHNEEEEARQSPPPNSPHQSPKQIPTPKGTPFPQQTPPHSPPHKSPPSPKQQHQQSPPPKHIPSPVRSDDFIYGDDDEDLTGFIATSFKFSLDGEEVSAPSISSAQFDSLNQKLDTLLASSSTQNSQQWESVLAANTKVL